MASRASPSCCQGPSLSAVVIGAAPLVLEHTHTFVPAGSGQPCKHHQIAKCQRRMT